MEEMMSAEGRRDFSNAHLQRGVINASLLSLLQVGLCYVLIKLKSGDQKNLAVARLCHVTATWFTNVSMTCMFASSTFAIKLLEPITSAVMQFAILGTPLSSTAAISLPLIVGGAIVFSGNPISETNLTVGMAAAFISNIILALRNVSLKLSSTPQAPVEMCVKPVNRGLVVVLLFCAGGVVSAWTYDYLSGQVLYLAATCTLSGVFHVLYSYVSTGIVLLRMSVVSHAVSNILKRLLVVLLLYMTGSRSASQTNFLGLLVCMLGLILYAWSKTATQSHYTKNKNAKENFRTPLWPTNGVKLAFLIVILLFVAFGIAFLKGFTTTKELRSATRSHQRIILTPSYDTTAQFDRTFTQQAHDLPRKNDLLPNIEGYLAQHRKDIHEFLQEDLYKRPNRSSFLSSKLHSAAEIAVEAQRIHFDVMGKVLRKFKYAMLLDIASFENKGDPCITVGETYFLARLKLEIVYYCSAYTCSESSMMKAAEKAKTFSTKELVILVHGGGNVAGYAFSDIHRFAIFKAFRNYKILVFPQSIWVRYWNFEHPHFKRCIKYYCCNENVTFVMRDHLSYSIAKEYFHGATKFILAPDMAFQVGLVKRFMSPVFDIMWIRRADGETPGYNEIPSPPSGIRLHVSDWWKWRTPGAPNSLEKAHYICTNGFFYLQRGRVIISDRLHGHILATLLNIPHVLIDNKAHKLSAYHSSWTASLENTVITNDPSKALKLAVELLHKYNSSLPPRVPFLNIDENLVHDKTFEEPETSYP
ncbi:triose phosphate/phosphate translocator, chloroplastic [Elysia marginata]|uniref:Triose phosphate/phosphate translocator, chloroplastic n=1 Tax=Elysia marginata TaxID=1093978 RepID=A0AAV4FRA2_9GAST|nr:triose phosphate/phosphate translocator, chloroplastic [Elysia marginata]